MDMYSQYKSPLGYYRKGNQIDSYGVDHSGFTTQDELAYQKARNEREKNLMNYFKDHELDGFPQYGTNFWGVSSDNNYGFGTSNITVPENITALSQNNGERPVYIFSPEMREALGWQESKGDYKGYTKKGGGIGALGKYQLRGDGLVDIDYMTKDNNQQYHWLKKNGIRSINDFLNNPEIQESALDEYMEAQQGFLKNNDSWKHIGKPIHGVVSDFNITPTGMLAAAHREGPGAVKNYIKNLEQNENNQYYMNYDKITKPKTKAMFKAIETRMRVFAK